MPEEEDGSTDGKRFDAESDSEEVGREMTDRAQQTDGEPGAGEMRPLRPGLPGPGCYPSGQLAELAAGRIDGGEADVMLSHASRCDACGPGLRVAVEAFDDKTTPQEEAILEKLQSGKADWRRTMAERMARAARREPVSWRWRAAAAVLAVIALGAFAALFVGEPDPEQLLARAYTAQRPFEYRLPDAGYAGDVRVERGPAGSRLDAPPELIEAEAIIARGAEENPSDPLWWHWRGQAELMRWAYEPARESLDRALELDPENAEYKADLALAHLLRAEAENRAIDNGQALELLLDAREALPNDARIVYNLALALERISDVREAARTWERYLELDATSPYADEAREHLEKLRAMADGVAPEPDPAGFLERLANGAAIVPEAYQVIALSEWLPRIATDPVAAEALGALASLTADRHGDPWLRDLIAAKGGSGAHRKLAEAVRRNVEGTHRQARLLARDAEAAYLAAGNRAGALRAAVEQAYSWQRMMAPPDCLAEADRVERALAGTPYSWMKGQLRTSRASCFYLSQELGPMTREFDAAERVAREARYMILALRAQGMHAGVKTSMGDHPGGWMELADCAANYWGSGDTGLRAQQCFMDLSHSASALGWPRAGLRLGRAAVEELMREGRHLMEARDHIDLAILAARAGEDAIANAEYETGRRIFGRMEQTKTVRVYEASGRIEAAEVLLSAENASFFSQELDGIGDWIATDAAPSFRLRHQQEVARARLLQGDFTGARVSYEEAVRLHQARQATAARDSELAALARTAAPAYRGLSEILLREGESPERVFALWERYRATVAGATEPGEAPDASRLTKETAVSFAMLPGGPYVWIADDRGVSGHRLAVTEEALAPVIDRLMNSCANPQSSLAAVTRDSRALYDWLVAPLESRLVAGRTIVISPDGPLERLSFAVLQDAREQWFGGQYPLVVATGPTAYAATRDRAPVTDSSVAVIVAGPQLGSDLRHTFPPLRGAVEEGSEVASQFPDAELITGKEATAGRVLDAAPRAELFHFAGHAYSAGGDAALLLAPLSGAVTTSRLLPSDLATGDWSGCRLVVLSACSTGSGQRLGAANPLTLVDGFLGAGAGGVLATRWNVDDEAARKLIARFYSSLLAGEAPEEALFGAARWVRDHDSSAHPYYWAGYQFFGG